MYPHLNTPPRSSFPCSRTFAPSLLNLLCSFRSRSRCQNGYIINEADLRGRTALVRAIMRDDLALVKLLLAHNADPRVLDQILSWSALHHAVGGKHKAIVAELLNNPLVAHITRPLVFHTDRDGHDCYQLAAQRGQVETCWILGFTRVLQLYPRGFGEAARPDLEPYVAAQLQKAVSAAANKHVAKTFKFFLGGLKATVYTVTWRKNDHIGNDAVANNNNNAAAGAAAGKAPSRSPSLAPAPAPSPAGASAMPPRVSVLAGSGVSSAPPALPPVILVPCTAPSSYRARTPHAQAAALAAPDGDVALVTVSHRRVRLAADGRGLVITPDAGGLLSKARDAEYLPFGPDTKIIECPGPNSANSSSSNLGQTGTGGTGESPVLRVILNADVEIHFELTEPTGGSLSAAYAGMRSVVATLLPYYRGKQRWDAYATAAVRLLSGVASERRGVWLLRERLVTLRAEVENIVRAEKFAARGGDYSTAKKLKAQRLRIAAEHDMVEERYRAAIAADKEQERRSKASAAAALVAANNNAPAPAAAAAAAAGNNNNKNARGNKNNANNASAQESAQVRGPRGANMSAVMQLLQEGVDLQDFLSSEIRRVSAAVAEYEGLQRQAGKETEWDRAQSAHLAKQPFLFARELLSRCLADTEAVMAYAGRGDTPPGTPQINASAVPVEGLVHRPLRADGTPLYGEEDEDDAHALVLAPLPQSESERDRAALPPLDLGQGLADMGLGLGFEEEEEEHGVLPAGDMAQERAQAAYPSVPRVAVNAAAVNNAQYNAQYNSQQQQSQYVNSTVPAAAAASASGFKLAPMQDPFSNSNYSNNNNNVNVNVNADVQNMSRVIVLQDTPTAAHSNNAVQNTVSAPAGASTPARMSLSTNAGPLSTSARPSPSVPSRPARVTPPASTVANSSGNSKEANVNNINSAAVAAGAGVAAMTPSASPVPSLSSSRAPSAASASSAVSAIAEQQQQQQFGKEEEDEDALAAAVAALPSARAANTSISNSGKNAVSGSSSSNDKPKKVLMLADGPAPARAPRPRTQPQHQQQQQQQQGVNYVCAGVPGAIVSSPGTVRATSTAGVPGAIPPPALTVASSGSVQNHGHGHHHGQQYPGPNAGSRMGSFAHSGSHFESDPAPPTYDEAMSLFHNDAVFFPEPPPPHGDQPGYHGDAAAGGAALEAEAKTSDGNGDGSGGGSGSGFAADEFAAFFSLPRHQEVAEEEE